MGYIEQTNLVKEYTNFLRNSDILTTTQRSVTTTTENFTTTLTGAETFTLSKANVKNIRRVTYDGSTISFGTDYDFNIDNATVIISAVIPAKAVVIDYDYGTDRVHPDYPRMDLTISSFPRIHFGKDETTIPCRKSYLPGQTDTLLDTLRQKVIAGFTSLYYCSYIHPGSVLDLGYYDTEKGKNKVYVKGLDVLSENNYEIN